VPADDASEHAYIAAARARLTAIDGDLATFDMEALAAIATLEANPLVADEWPRASAGGGFSAIQGTPIVPDATGSTAPAPLVDFAWDLDGDGVFDDATGPMPSVVFNVPGNHLIGVTVTDVVGRVGQAWSLVSVAATNAPPTVIAA